MKKRVITGDETWVYGYDLETKDNHPNGSVQKTSKTEKIRSVKCETFAHFFLRLQWRDAS